MTSIFDWEVRRVGMREGVQTRNDSGLRIWIFSQKLPFSVKKNVSKTNLGSTIHYTYTSYYKYFKLLWFQRSSGSMKSVSSFSSLDFHEFHFYGIKHLGETIIRNYFGHSSAI